MAGTPSRFREVEAARARWGDEVVDRSLRAITVGDDSADRLVAALRRMPAGAGSTMLDEALELGPTAVRDAPPELEVLLAPVLDPPSWVDFDLVDAGALAWWRVGAVPQLLALTAGSLAYGYGLGTFARALTATGRLTQMAPRRLGETARWVLAAARPAALRPGGAGLAATVRLRLVHAAVRTHLRSAGGWDTANWGEPLSAYDVAATGMGGFFIVPLRALQDLGVRYSAAELEAIAHQWRYISHLLGAPDEFLPRNFSETVEWAQVGLALDGGPIAESAALIDALLFGGLRFDRLLPGPAAALARAATGQGLGAFARRWMGDERADELGVPSSPLRHAIVLLRPLMRARELARAAGLLGSDERTVALELALAERVLDAAGVLPAAIGPEQAARAPVLATAA